MSTPFVAKPIKAFFNCSGLSVGRLGGMGARFWTSRGGRRKADTQLGSDACVRAYNEDNEEKVLSGGTRLGEMGGLNVSLG